MGQKEISSAGIAQVLERDPVELSDRVVAELADLVQRAENPEEAKSGTKAVDWTYRVPFAGVRYYSYE